ncbi:hypothetical protein IE53DRAFT_386294 [Violaceomyces palustris]|uniref:Uncharacterized protein n=1 Tax=Violaceomyces palustris TaxID=1673888 RepID=A0ACD0NZU7_9BASI|nr:hypothetical protein IE53DRAFT_386294 [Violaceomyces palustris]
MPAKTSSPLTSVRTNNGFTSQRPPRICKKVVLKGSVTHYSASYTLYLKVELPDSPRAQTYPLLPDAGLRLKSSHVHPLDSHGAASALSGNAASAASYLGIPLSIDDNFLPTLTPERLALQQEFAQKPDKQEGGSGDARRRSITPSRDFGGQIPKVTVANFQVSLVAPPLNSDAYKPPPTPASTTATTSSSSSSKPAPASRGKNLFIVVLNLEVGLSQRPPKAPNVVKLPIPYCLNNFLRFTIDETVSSEEEGIAVEIHPTILPRNRARRSKTSITAPDRTFTTDLLESDDEDDAITLGPTSDEESSDGDGMSISGPFASCEAVTIRWASPTAGNFPRPSAVGGEIANALRADEIRTNLRYSVAGRALFEKHAALISPNSVLLQVDVDAELNGAFYPGLEQEAILRLELDSFGQKSQWVSVQAAPNRLIKACGRPTVGNTDILDKEKVSPLPLDELKRRLSREPSPQNDPIGMNGPPGDEDDLLLVEPPKGLQDSDLDFSLDEGIVQRPRRHSISSRGTSRSHTPAPEEDDVLENDGTAMGSDLQSSSVDLTLDLATLGEVEGSRGGVRFSLSGLLAISPMTGRLPESSQDQSASLALPVLRTPTIPTHDCCVQAIASFQAAFEMDLVRLPQASGKDGRLFLEARANPSRPPPGHGFDLEAHVVSLSRSPISEDLNLPVESSQAVVKQEETGRSSESWRTQTQDHFVEEGDEGVSLCSSKATYEVWPCQSESGERRLMVVMDFQWPTAIGSFKPPRTARFKPTQEAQIRSAFVNKVAASFSKDEQSQENQYQLQIPGDLVGLKDGFEAQVTLSLPWKDEMERECIKAELPTLCFETAHVSIRVHTVDGYLLTSNSNGRIEHSVTDESDKSLVLTAFQIPRNESVRIDVQLSHKVDVIATPGPSTASQIQDAGKPRSKEKSRSHASVCLAISNLIWTVFLTFFTFATFYTLEPAIHTLNLKVDQLAMANDIDFRDGTWMLPNPPSSSVSKPFSAQEGQGFPLREGRSGSKSAGDEIEEWIKALEEERDPDARPPTRDDPIPSLGRMGEEGSVGGEEGKVWTNDPARAKGDGEISEAVASGKGGVPGSVDRALQVREGGGMMLIPLARILSSPLVIVGRGTLTFFRLVSKVLLWR